MNNRKIRVAITHGDTNGIGYELIFKTFAEPEMLELCTPIIYGSPKVAAYHHKALGIPGNFTIIKSAANAEPGKLNLLPVFDEDVKVELGVPTPESGRAAVKALDRAITDYKTASTTCSSPTPWTSRTCTSTASTSPTTISSRCVSARERKDCAS